MTERVDSIGRRIVPSQHAHKTTHGYFGTPTYMVWHSMKRRCTMPSSQGYARYGGRGIKVCERWMKFENFLADMGEKPKGLSIDRIDNDGNYEPGNCRWATHSQQRNNQGPGRAIHLTFRGETHSISEWAKRTGLKHPTIRERIHAGWSVEDALTAPLKPGDKSRVKR